MPVVFEIFYGYLFRYLIVTGARSKMVVTLSKKADTTALKTQSKVINGHTLPFASL